MSNNTSDKPTKISQFFNERADSYDQHMKQTVTSFEKFYNIISIPIDRTKEIVEILDLGCGTGRHAVELAKRGYQVTGVDISSGMLAEAKKTAQEAKVKIEWIHSDATQFISDKLFDAALCLCEGAFSLLCKDDDPIEHDLTILQNIHTALELTLF